MNGYNWEWRICAKVVAFLDLIFTVLHLLAFLPLIYTVKCLSALLVHQKVVRFRIGLSFVDDFEVDSSTFVALWLAVAVMAMKLVAGLWAAQELIKASELGRDTNCAFNSCVYWLVVSIGFLFHTIIFGCLFNFYITMTGVLIVESILLFVVCMFMLTLK